MALSYAVTREEVISVKKFVVLACVISVMAVLAITAGSAFAGLLSGTPVGPTACPALEALSATPAGAVYSTLCG